MGVIGNERERARGQLLNMFATNYSAYEGRKSTEVECVRIAPMRFGENLNKSGQLQRIASFFKANRQICMVANALPYFGTQLHIQSFIVAQQKLNIIVFFRC